MSSSQIIISVVDVFLAGCWFKHWNLFFFPPPPLITHGLVLALLIQVDVTQASYTCLAVPIIHSLKEMGKGTTSQEDLGRTEALSTLLVVLLVPLRLWKTAPTFIFFCNATKFFAVIDDAFTASKSLSQSNNSSQRWGEEGSKHKNKRNSLTDPCVWSRWCAEISDDLLFVINWEAWMCSRQPQNQVWRKTSGVVSLKTTSGCIKMKNVESFFESYFWIWISTLQDHHFSSPE